MLENGPASVYAGHFDIDWDPPEAKLRDLVLVPVLRDRYRRVLEAGELVMARGTSTASPSWPCGYSTATLTTATTPRQEVHEAVGELLACPSRTADERYLAETVKEATQRQPDLATSCSTFSATCCWAGCRASSRPSSWCVPAGVGAGHGQKGRVTSSPSPARAACSPWRLGWSSAWPAGEGGETRC